MGMKQKNKFENCEAFDSSQRNWDFQLPQFSFKKKNPGIDAKGYMVVRLSDVSSKKGWKQ